MKNYCYLIALLCVLGVQNIAKATRPYQQQLINEAYRRVMTYNRTLPVYHPMVKVVYFHPSDQAPLNNWQDRLSHTLDSVSNYYRDELARYGIITNGVPFEKRNGRFVIYPIQGTLKASAYNPQSGQAIERQIEQQSKGKINFATDYVLVVNGLCFRDNEGTYVFHSPYHGWGSLTSGVCHVADCEQLDSHLLTDTVHKMTFTEMAITKKTCSVAEFNSWYVGGIAHELGHVFGLPHDFGNPLELDSAHTSMMGEHGSRHFKDYLWQGNPSAYFSAASVFQLLSHPFFTGKKSSKPITSDFQLKELFLTSDTNGLTLSSTVSAAIQPYGLVALVRPEVTSEYFNRSFCALFDAKSRSVKLSMPVFKYSGIYVLRMLYLFPNGMVKSVEKNFSMDKEGKVELMEAGPVTFAGLYRKLQKMPQTPSVVVRLGIVDSLLHPPVPIDPVSFKGNRLVLADAKWLDAKVGWENVARNYFSLEDESRFFLELQGKLYSKGLYAHSPSTYVFVLDGKWKTFSGIVGLRDGADIQGSAHFTVLGDGKVVFESKALRVNMQESFRVDISGVKTLTLQTNGTEGHCHNSWAIWVNPVLER